MTIKAVVWDLGGVLVRTEDYSSRHALATRLNIEPGALEHLVFSDEAGMRTQRGEIPVEQHWENIRQYFGLTPQGLKNFINEFFAGDVLDLELVSYIRSLRSQYKIGLLSNAFSDLRHMLEDVWCISDVFDEIVISAEVGMVKPDARIFLLAAGRLKIDPQEAVFVDDFRHNVEGARAVAMHAVHFQNAIQARKDLEKTILDNNG